MINLFNKFKITKFNKLHNELKEALEMSIKSSIHHKPSNYLILLNNQFSKQIRNEIHQGNSEVDLMKYFITTDFIEWCDDKATYGITRDELEDFFTPSKSHEHDYLMIDKDWAQDLLLELS